MYIKWTGNKTVEFKTYTLITLSKFPILFTREKNEKVNL